jgi:hypothetical protein
MQVEYIHRVEAEAVLTDMMDEAIPCMPSTAEVRLCFYFSVLSFVEVLYTVYIVYSILLITYT